MALDVSHLKLVVRDQDVRKNGGEVT